MNNKNIYTVTFTTRNCITAFLFICLQLMCFQTHATMGINNDFNKLISQADAVVVGKCTNVSSEWRNKKIFSKASIQIDTTIKGDLPAEISVEYMGGTAIHPVLKTPVAMKVSNGIEFSKNDEAVLLLKISTNNSYRVIGAERGKVVVINDADTGEKVIQSGARKIEAKISAEDNSTVLSSRKMKLQEFIDFIHSRIKIEAERGAQ